VDRQPVSGIWPARDVLWLVVDGAAALVLLILSVSGAAARQASFGLPGWLTVTAAAAAAAPVAVRRRWPAGVFAVVLTANSIAAVAGVSGNPAVLVALALYPVAVTQPPRRAAVAAAAAMTLSTAAEAAGLVASPQPPGTQAQFYVLATSIAALAAAWALGAARRSQLLYAARATAQATRRAVADERLRIARELHDVITHSMSLITVKASVANYLIDSRPQEVRDALTVIEDTGRNALAEMRRMLGVLRADSDTGSPCPGGTSDGRRPAPGLADLAGLAGHAAAGGVQVDLDVDPACDLPDGVALAVYRIVQEALTNVVKHAAPTRCQVRVGRTAQEVLIEVTDAGNARRPQAGAAGGHGLIGMRERAALFGGELAAGHARDGGFRVTARLPLAAAAPVAPVAPAARADGPPPR
jgi:signal transduction histidine kinase